MTDDDDNDAGGRACVPWHRVGRAWGKGGVRRGGMIMKWKRRARSGLARARAGMGGFDATERVGLCVTALKMQRRKVYLAA